MKTNEQIRKDIKAELKNHGYKQDTPALSSVMLFTHPKQQNIIVTQNKTGVLEFYQQVHDENIEYLFDTQDEQAGS